MVARPCIASLKPRGHMIRQKPETSIPTLSLLLNNRKTMHKQTSFLLAAIATATHAAEQPASAQTPAPPPAAPAGQQQPQPTYDEHYRNTLAALDSLNSILATVKDKASADQAAEQAFAIYDELNKIPLPPIIKQTPEEEQHRVEQQYAERKNATMQQFQQHIGNISVYEGYTSDRMCEFIVKLQEDHWIDHSATDFSNAQTDPAKLQILEREIPAFFDKTLEDMENLNSLLQTVQNTASADAAAEKLTAFIRETETRRDRLIEQYGRSPRNMVARIIPPRMQRMETIRTATETIRKKLEQQNYYGSETLKNAIQKFSRLL